MVTHTRAVGIVDVRGDGGNARGIEERQLRLEVRLE